uniref:Bestrophin homolog n=1 Tax=Ditylum brightwellii TaxID=49249 RepID=A0A7S4UXZ8_9STRA
MTRGSRKYHKGNALRGTLRIVAFVGTLSACIKNTATAFVVPFPSAINTHKHVFPHCARDRHVCRAEFKNPTAGEESRKFRRDVFTYKDWVESRKPDRIYRKLGSTLNSGVVKGLGKELTIVAILSTMVIVWNSLLSGGWVDFSGVGHDPLIEGLPMIELPMNVFTLSSPALGLMLVFRTNTSYNRWAEARAKWGSIINHTRNIVRMGEAWCDPKLEPNPYIRAELLDNLSRAVWSFPRSLARHLSNPEEDEEPFKQEVREKLKPERAEALIAARHRPCRSLHDISFAANAIPMPYMRRNKIDKSITVLIDDCGACERIFGSPVPLVYTRHTARFLYVWHLLLPFALWGAFDYSWNHIMLIPANVFISVFMFGIEELATQLEEPFSVLPMQFFSDGIYLLTREYPEWGFDEEFPFTYGNDDDWRQPF